MKEYTIENGGNVERKKLKATPMPLENYRAAHAGLVIPCHDVFIAYPIGSSQPDNKGILLVRRDNDPARGELWPIGGRMLRGISCEESLERKAMEECNLRLQNIIPLGVGRTLFESDPFGHGKGTDTINLVYFAEGKGDLKLNDLHSQPTLVTPQMYTSLRDNLHPYVKEFMDLAIERLQPKGQF